MIIVVVFLSASGGDRRLVSGRPEISAAKPWLEQGVIGDLSDPDQRQPLLAKMGLGFFLAVVGALFALLASAYAMRAMSGDWQSAPMPRCCG